MSVDQGTVGTEPPLALDGFAEWIVQRGLLGLPLEDQLAGFCQRVHDAGLPMQRANMGLATLHPRWGAHTFIWRPGFGAVERTPRDRSFQQLDAYRRSPAHYLRARKESALRRRLDTGGPFDFPILDELLAEGLTDYAARIVPYEPLTRRGPQGDSLNGIFFSCATDRPEGFDTRQLAQLDAVLPYLALAIKARATLDVAETVVETYLGADAGRRVLTGEIQRGAVQTIRAVIWFCDLRGFTRLSDSVPRDELVELLDDYFDALAAPVHENGGQILKFLGDGFLATFDLTGHDDQTACVSALKAAMELRDRLPRFNASRLAAGKPVMDFGLAVHLGDVLYGNIGTDDRLDFTVIGPAVNEASRIQALCRPLGRNVLISSAFSRIARDCRQTLTSIGLHEVPDLEEPRELFVLAD